MEPEASFDKRDDWAHIFSMDEGVGYKLMSAIYDAKVCDALTISGGDLQANNDAELHAQAPSLGTTRTTTTTAAAASPASTDYTVAGTVDRHAEADQEGGKEGAFYRKGAVAIIERRPW